MLFFDDWLTRPTAGIREPNERRALLHDFCKVRRGHALFTGECRKGFAGLQVLEIGPGIDARARSDRQDRLDPVVVTLAVDDDTITADIDLEGVNAGCRGGRDGERRQDLVVVCHRRVRTPQVDLPVEVGVERGIAFSSNRSLSYSQ